MNVIITIPWSLLVPDNQKQVPVPVTKGQKVSRIMTSTKYRNAKTSITAYMREQTKGMSWPIWPTEEVRCAYEFYPPNKRKTDVANYLKILNDAMQGVLVTDDYQIVRLEVDRMDIDRTNPRVEINMWAD